MIMTMGCSPTGNKRGDSLLDGVELPTINPKYTCDDLYQWRQQILMIYKKQLDAKEKQLKRHQ
jgi:hypothetical protein